MNRAARSGRSARITYRQAGFSLMELLIASVLAVIVSGMMFSVLTSQERLSKQTESYAQLQDRLRSALLVASRQVRMAGYGVGNVVAGTEATSILYPSGSVPIPSLSGVPTIFACDGCGNYDYDASQNADQVTSGTNGTDQIGLVYRNPSLEFQLNWSTYETLSSTNALLSCGGLTQLMVQDIPTDLLDGTKDTRRIIPAGDIVCMDETSVTTTQSSLAWTLRSSVIIDATLGLAIPVQPGNSPEFLAACPTSIPRRMTCGSLVGSTIGLYVYHETLYMDDNGDSFNVASRKLEPRIDGSTKLPVDDIPLATGIEDMQIAYCIPKPAAGATIANMSAALADCLSLPDTSSYWRGSSSTYPLTNADVIYALAARITLVVKGKIDPAGRKFVSARPAVENHTPSDVPDSSSRPSTTRYPRAIQSTVVQLPNRRYLQGLVQEFYK